MNKKQTKLSAKPSMAERKAQSKRDRAMAQSKKSNKSNKPRRQSGSNMTSGRIAAPASQFTPRTPRFEISKSAKGSDAIRIKGQDFISGLVIPSGTVPGTMLYNTGINPLVEAFEGTRLAKFAQLYEKYVFRRVDFHVQSSAPSSASGSYILAYDRDIADDTPSASNLGLKTYYGMKNSKSTSIWSDLTITCPLDDTQDFYYTNYTGYDARLTHQGQIYIAALSPITAGVSINLWVSYDIDLMVPELEEQNAAVSTNINLGILGPGTGPTPLTAGVNQNLLTVAASASLDELQNDTVTSDEAKLNTEIPDQAAYELPEGTYDAMVSISSTGGGQIVPSFSVYDKDSGDLIEPYKVIQADTSSSDVDNLSDFTYRAIYEVGKAGARMFPKVSNELIQDLYDLFTWIVPSEAKYLKGSLFTVKPYSRKSGDLRVGRLVNQGTPALSQRRK
jgi:hypothetical protein